MITLDQPENFVSWKAQVKPLLGNGIAPSEVHWQSAESLSLFEISKRPLTEEKKITLPASFFEMGEYVAHHRDPDRWLLLYRVAYRILNGEHHLLKIHIDDDVRRCELMVKAVSREIHKMHAFVRFREVMRENVLTYEAWYNPHHPVLRLAAPFFKRRFGDRPWIIATPDETATYDLHDIHYGPGLSKVEMSGEDPFDDLWRVYYESIANPARLNLRAMKKEMPVRYWQDLPEARSIQKIIVNAPHRLATIRRKTLVPAAPPESSNWVVIQKAALQCQACDIFRNATQTVFGEGPVNARLMIVGEQPGDIEDRMGRPFVGPSGELFNSVLNEAGLDRKLIYVTNAVKHFKFEPSQETKVRIHKRPTGSEMHCCKPWLEKEIEIIKPKVILALGATAALSILGKQIKITQDSGKVFEWLHGISVIPSWHPSAILREQIPELKNQKRTELFNSIVKAQELSKPLASM